ncbi:hypothetical protein Fcan01_19803 [Folsomia candida]|uniref:Uncharacterized protein n=1 Tax=Folsomia candida TaxID=158441 RepID=A0A226DI26_FOLCA|nr:hypothetical protein Fcan01_19803 [Folsomia candida]
MKSNRTIGLIINSKINLIGGREFLDADLEDLVARLYSSFSSSTSTLSTYFPRFIKACSKLFSSLDSTNPIFYRISPTNIILRLLEIGDKFPPFERVSNWMSGNEYADLQCLYNNMGCERIISLLEKVAVTKILQYSDVLMHFVNYCMKHFLLSPLHCKSLSSYAFNAAMCNGRVEFEFCKDERIINWIQANNVTGISCSNYKFCASSPNEVIFSVDSNSAFPGCCRLPLPQNGYRYLSDHELSGIDYLNFPDDGPYGFI